MKRSHHRPFLGIFTQIRGRLWALSSGEEFRFLKQLLKPHQSRMSLLGFQSLDWDAVSVCLSLRGFHGSYHKTFREEPRLDQWLPHPQGKSRMTGGP